MSIEIPVSYVQVYKGNVLTLSQQKGSRLRMCVTTETTNGKYINFERVGATVAQKRTTRHGKTPLVNTPHSRRRASMDDYEWADLIDNQDKVRLLIDPQGVYATNGANALGRTADDILIAAMRGNAYSVDADEAASTVALPAAQKVAASATGMTLDKVLATKEIFDAADVDPDEERYLALTSHQLKALLNTTEIKSADYNTVKALAQGQLDTFLGFKFIRTERLIKVSTSRFCLAWVKSGVGLALGEDIKTRIDERVDLSYAVQVYLSMTMGATRIEDAKVVEIECVES